MNKLTFQKRVWIVKQYNKGTSTSKLAMSQSVTSRTVQMLVKTFKEDGWDALKDHKTGRPETKLNPNAEIVILDLRKRFGYGACHIEQILKKKGFGISHRQIEKLLIRNGLVEPNIKKQRSRKYRSFEMPKPNDMAHTDWTYDPFTTRNFSVFIDDRTRLITSNGLFKRATAENSIALLKSAVAYYGKPKTVMTDHGVQYYSNHKGSNQENTKFRIALNALGIKHYLARVNRPQTNGKVERFFLTYKTEYATGSFSCIKDFIKHYNEERLHMSLGYRTPKEVWDELVNVN